MHSSLLKNAKYFLTISLLALTSPSLHAAPATAPVSGFARSFLLGMSINSGNITVLETGEKFKTDQNGHFGPFQHPVGKPVTLEFSKMGYKTTQSSTVMVPPEGLNDAYHNITFQVPSVESYYALAYIIRAKIDKNSCHLTATVTKFHKTMDDIPQGEEGVTVAVSPSVSEKPFYFGIFERGPLKKKTNPFAKNLAATSEDGGVAFFNLPASDQPYKLIASKDGMKFTESTFMCRKGVFINISPPRGPMVVE